MKICKRRCDYTFCWLKSKEKTGKTLPYKPKSRSITGMEKAEIKSIADYLKDLEEEAVMLLRGSKWII
jgi:hypothetical protein